MDSKMPTHSYWLPWLWTLRLLPRNWWCSVLYCSGSEKKWNFIKQHKIIFRHISAHHFKFSTSYPTHFILNTLIISIVIMLDIESFDAWKFWFMFVCYYVVILLEISFIKISYTFWMQLKRMQQKVSKY